jgi:hypothetical protein
MSHPRVVTIISVTFICAICAIVIVLITNQRPHDVRAERLWGARAALLISNARIVDCHKKALVALNATFDFHDPELTHSAIKERGDNSIAAIGALPSACAEVKGIHEEEVIELMFAAYAKTLSK